MAKKRNPAPMAIGGEAGCSKLAGDEQSTYSTRRHSHATIPDSAHSIYGGRVHLGWITERGERYEAIGSDRVSLGLFNKSEAAYRALIREVIMTGGAS